MSLIKPKPYKVKFKGRAGYLTYSEGNKILNLEYELFFDPAGITIWVKDQLAWEAPYDREEISKQSIIKNITDDLEKRGYKVDWA